MDSGVDEVVSKEETEFRENVFEAVREEDRETLKNLLQDPKSRSWSLDFYRCGSTPLTLAAQYGYYPICNLLLKHKPKPNVNKVNIAFSCLSLFHYYWYDVLFSLKTG